MHAWREGTGRKNKVDSNRRTFIKGSAAALGLGAVGIDPFSVARAQSYPSRTINVVVATRAGGGAGRDLRTFNSVWRK